MVNQSTVAPTTLVLRHVFNAPIERVYDAWLTPEILREFYCPDDNTGAFADVDARIGGAYRIGMRLPDGEIYVSYGVFRELDRPRKIVCTQQWEEDEKALEHETLMTLEFVAKGSQTELTLTHQNLRDEKSRDSHAEGWAGCFTKLEAVVAR
jgi:uncharacterized protein YndB with AHSA1/START domain